MRGHRPDEGEHRLLDRLQPGISRQRGAGGGETGRLVQPFPRVSHALGTQGRLLVREVVEIVRVVTLQRVLLPSP